MKMKMKIFNIKTENSNKNNIVEWVFIFCLFIYLFFLGLKSIILRIIGYPLLNEREREREPNREWEIIK